MIDNLPERRAIDGDVDFTMMYAAHDAFARHLDRLAAALDVGTVRPAVASAWRIFATQLHIHHTAEDEVLWPLLRNAVPSEQQHVLDAMEAEHEQLDPLLERIDDEVDAGRSADAAASIRELATSLRQHMRHEENEALPLIETHLGTSGWGEFAQRMRSTIGYKGAAVYFPWVLDGASDAMSRAVLGLLPVPARLLYRRSWLPRYRRTFGLA
jgi:hypothetical protein